MRAGRGRRLPGRSRGRLARHRRLPRPRRRALRARALLLRGAGTRSSRGARSRTPSSSSLLLARARADPGAAARADARRPRHGRVRCSGRPTSPPSSGGARAASRRVATAADDVAVSLSGRALRALRLPRALRDALGGRRPPEPGRRIRRDQIERLNAAGVPTLDGARRTAPGTRIARMAPQTFEQLRDQAALQLSARRTRDPPLRPAPAARRSAASACSRRLRRATSSSTSRATRSGARARARVSCSASSTAMTTALALPRVLGATTATRSKPPSSSSSTSSRARLAQLPDLHVYHYAPYEPTALKRLMGGTATREDEVDDLLRREVFVDLYTVVRQALRISHPSYSLKDVEAFFMPRATPSVTGRRRLDRRATSSGCETGRRGACSTAIARLQRGGLPLDAGAARLAARASAEAEASHGPIPWPRAAERAPSRPDGELERARRAGGAPRDAAREAAEPAATRSRELLELPPARGEARLVGVLRAAAARRRRSSIEDAEAIGGLEPATGRRRRGRAVARARARFPRAAAQARGRRRGRRPGDAEGRGTIAELDDERGRSCGSARGTVARGRPLPRALIPAEPIAQDGAGARRCAGSRDVARRDGRYPALETLLRREPPLRRPTRAARATTLEEQGASLDGSRATSSSRARPARARRTGARLIARPDRARAAGRRRRESHKAIDNLLDEVERRRADGGRRVPRARRRRRRQRGVALREHAHRDGDATTTFLRRPRRSSSSPARAGSSRARSCDGDARRRCSSTRPARSRSPTRSRSARRARDARPARRPAAARAGHAGHHPRGRGRVGARAPARRRATTVPPDRGLFLEQHLAACTRTSAASSPRRSTTGGSSSMRRAASARRSRRRAPALGCAAGRARRATAQSLAEEAERVAAEIARLLGGAVHRRDGVDAAAHARRHPRRRALQRPGALPARAAAGGRAGRHGRQVPGPGGAGRLLLDGELERRGRPARPGLPVQPQPAQRRRLAGAGLAVVVCSPRLLEVAAAPSSRCGS